jgi:hypothetical protein
MAEDHIIFILEEYRTMPVVTALVTRYVEWARLRRVKVAMLRNITGEKVDEFNHLAEKLGFRLIGTCHAMEL